MKFHKFMQLGARLTDWSGMVPFVFQYRHTEAPEEVEVNREPLDLPYPFICVEVEGNHVITSPHPDEADDQAIYIIVMAIRELSIGNYEIYLIVRDRDGREGAVKVEHAKDLLVRGHDIEESKLQLQQIVRIFLERLQADTVGSATPRQKTKFKVGKTNKFFRPKHVFVVGGNGGRYERMERIGGSPIRWNTAHFVRGHWRKINSIGLSRSGERVIDGYTWVRPHKKGIGQAELKPYIVKG